MIVGLAHEKKLLYAKISVESDYAKYGIFINMNLPYILFTDYLHFTTKCVQSKGKPRNFMFQFYCKNVCYIDFTSRVYFCGNGGMIVLTFRNICEMICAYFCIYSRKICSFNRNLAVKILQKY